MAKAVVNITVTYGSSIDAIVLNAVMVAASELGKDGIEPRILQVYQPGAKLKVSVNGVEIDIDENLHEKIIETAYASLIEEDYTDHRDFLVDAVAAATSWSDES
ncbi:MAG: hypothetical protein GXO43_07615 [Crenarchaeota archaeon]|nr:hypothetical protein [Thermoproteota archaeon]